MKIRKKGKNFEVESSKKGKFYAVDLTTPSCTCAHFLFRLRSNGGKCKHIIAVEEKHSKIKKSSQKSIDSFSKVLDEVKKNGEVETVILMEKFGESEIQELIDKGDLIEFKGKIKLTE